LFKNSQQGSQKGAATRRRVLTAALELFRKRGFEQTNMRDVAERAGLSLGAAYHYFRSKDDLVRAYYGAMQDEHEELVRTALPKAADWRARLLVIFETKLTLVRRDRRLLSALLGHLGDPSHSLSVFSRRNAAIRKRGVRQFVEVLTGAGLPSHLLQLLGSALWLAHLGLLLFLLHDRSRGQAKTRAVLAGVMTSLPNILPLLASPALAPLLGIFAETSATQPSGSGGS
jgi:AcrR family transcriptional regulator